jgi:cytoskeletal protein RodZ
MTDGAVPALRRRWMRRLGWYPGDWVWLSLLTLLVAVAGAAVAIVITRHRDERAGQTFVAKPTQSVQQPTAVPTTTPPTVNTATLPTAPEPTTSPQPTKPKAHHTGPIAWPANENGWTIVLVSYPKTTGRTEADATAARAAKNGLHQVGVLDSSSYASLVPGYYVVFTGIYGSKALADAAVSTARQAGFGGAYSRQIAR